MKKYIQSIVFMMVATSVFLLAATAAHAQSLEVTSIGGISTGGSLTTWTHEGYNPLIVGTASPSSTVTIDVDSVIAATASAGTDGSWQYQPTALNSYGSYEFAISAGSESVLFTLVLAEPSSSSSTAKGGASTSGSVEVPEELPQSGSDDIVLLIAAGMFLIISGAYVGAHSLGYFSET